MSGIQNTADLQRVASHAHVGVTPHDTTPSSTAPHSTVRDGGDTPQGRTSPSTSRPPQRSLQAQQTARSEPSMAITEARRSLSIRSVHAARDADVAQAAEAFGALVEAGQARRLTDKDVVQAVLFQALAVGGGAAFAFGLGRSLGADVAEMIVRGAFGSPQLAGVGPDTANYDVSDRHTAMMLTNAVARWVGATVGGGVGAAVGNVAAPRMAALAGRQLLPVPADVLVPDHVAGLLAPDGQPYGEPGVAHLRAQVAAAH